MMDTFLFVVDHKLFFLFPNPNLPFSKKFSFMRLENTVGKIGNFFDNDLLV